MTTYQSKVIASSIFDHFLTVWSVWPHTCMHACYIETIYTWQTLLAKFFFLSSSYIRDSLSFSSHVSCLATCRLEIISSRFITSFDDMAEATPSDPASWTGLSCSRLISSRSVRMRRRFSSSFFLDLLVIFLALLANWSVDRVSA